MTSQSDWRAELTSLDRYNNIQALKALLESTCLAVSAADAQRDAFAIETDAYKASSSRTQYDAACQALPSNQSQGDLVELEPHAPETISDSPAIRIGQYPDCHYIASGVTAQVYRSKTIALKVIVETRDIEPHNPSREAKILQSLKTPCIPLLETFRDQEQRFVLAFPYMPLSLDALISQGSISSTRITNHFKDLFTALDFLHSRGIIHRDVKPSAVLLKSADGPAYLSDFGTAWHPELSVYTEPADQKILDIGTDPYRAPEALFGDKSYGPAVDMWAAGAMLAECCRTPNKPLFESRAAHEDGNQLGLILSIFKAIGSPTRDSWPEAAHFKTPPFEMYRFFEAIPWDDILPDVDKGFRGIIVSLIQYSSKSRPSASQILQSAPFCGSIPQTDDVV
ncbi:serine/threonine-protein kinase csk1 [Xylariaceae sp. FL1272]|nr:serine/threonine-protein kinase csk1 [Xylariaceae sp. FL1272]